METISNINSYLSLAWFICITYPLLQEKEMSVYNLQKFNALLVQLS